MKVTALDDELINEISNTSLYLIRAINFYRRRPEHRFTHTQIGRNMQKAQGTVSKMLSESNISHRSAFQFFRITVRKFFTLIGCIFRKLIVMLIHIQ